MMKKKLVAILAIATMLLGTVPVNAAQLTSDQGQKEVTGTGTVIDYDRTPKYQVTLPTNKAFDFVIDPNGLLNLASGGATAATLATGTVEIGVASSAAAVIKNESNVPIIVNTKFTVSNTGKAQLVTTDRVLTNAAGEATDAAIYLKVVPAKAKTVMTTAPALASDYALVLTGNNQMSFKLNAAAYVVERHGDDNNSTFSVRLATTAANYDATVLKLQGKVNKADWTEYSKDVSPAALGLTAVFSYKPCTTNVDLVDPTDTRVHGLISGQAAEAPSFTCNTKAVIAVSGGSGDEKFASLEKIEAPYAGQVYEFKDQTTVNVTNGEGTITVNASFLAGWASVPENPTTTITYKTVGGETKTATVTLISY